MTDPTAQDMEAAHTCCPCDSASGNPPNDECGPDGPCEVHQSVATAIAQARVEAERQAAASLIAHDNALIERCAAVCDMLAVNSNEWGSYCMLQCAIAVRALKTDSEGSTT